MGIFQKNESVRMVSTSNNNLPYSTNNLYSVTDDIISQNELNKYRLLKSTRNEKYNSYDLMAQDSRIASVLNMYADDCTQFNQSSQVIWAESSDPNCAKFVNRIIDVLQLNKLAWTHIYTLCKYGDLYLELFYDKERFDTDGLYQRPVGSMLLEQIESVKNPASIFELAEHGKTRYYVKVFGDDNHYVGAPLQTLNLNQYNHDNFEALLPADKYIHISINDAYNRFGNKYVVSDNDTGDDSVFDVKEGNSILDNAFKTWSELNLLEDSLLLNRLSRSAIIRLIQIEVGNTDDNDTQDILRALRDKISRSRYMDKGNGDYKNQVNPGPLENIIYHSTHNGNGAITHSTIGGDVNVKDIADIDYFLQKLANAFPVPKAYLTGQNDDGGGLSAGTSLTKFDAKYGRTLKRIQNAYIYGITDLINVYADKKGLQEYINDFTIKMISPSAVEENERDEKLANHTTMIRDIMTIINDEKELYADDTRRNILNYLMQSMLQDTGLSNILYDDDNYHRENIDFNDNENLKADEDNALNDNFDKLEN